MSVSSAMFLFEVVLESVDSLVESRKFIIRSDFADIFSLELKDPKQMHIPMPEPLPLPPEPPGRKGKKNKKEKSKKRGKKDKKYKDTEPPSGPVIQSGQSVLFSSTAEFLIQSMKKFPLQLSLWSNEDNFAHIGSALIPWDLNFITYLQNVYDCCDVPPTVKINETYNIFEEGTAKLMAKVGIQIKLTYLADKITTAFRTLSEDPAMMRILYTGLNSKTTSYICNMKTRGEEKIDHTYVKDVSKSDKIKFASYKNAASVNLVNFKEENYCCKNNADKPPSTEYKIPELAPSIDFVIDYVRKIIISCNDNMRILTPRLEIKPKVKATDIDKLCYCQKSNWPDDEIAVRFKNEVQSSPCAICAKAVEDIEKARENTFNLSNIRGPCGKTDCRIARYMKSYIQTLIEEDNKEVNINDIVGPCGSKDCKLARKVQQILRHEGAFKKDLTGEGLSTQCACMERLQSALDQDSCMESNPNEWEENNNVPRNCLLNTYSFKEPTQNVYNVYYFAVEYDMDANSTGTSTPQSSKHKYCSSACPSLKESKASKSFCSRSICSTTYTDKSKEIECRNSPFSTLNVSPADSNVEILFDEIQNPCKLESCFIADKIKDIIVDGVTNRNVKTTDTEHCFCECVCNFNFSRQTTYCSVCGGYEFLGDDTQDMPDFLKPQPCPVFHKMYNKDLIKVKSPSLSNLTVKQSRDNNKTLRLYSKSENTEKNLNIRCGKNFNDSEYEKKDNQKPTKPKKLGRIRKPVGKFTANVKSATYKIVAEPKPKKKKYYRYPPVPKEMGWKWDAESIPGMEPRPQWKPGAAKKALVRRYRAIREGVDVIGKKKRAMMQKKKKLEMKPTLVITKKNGEYTVQMEVFKVYSKERLPYQYPYDEKPPLVYTIGKSEEEKRKIQKLQERNERRAARHRNRFLQSTFRDKCQEICLKAHNQAIGSFSQDINDPECPCHKPAVENIQSVVSCSCSDGKSVSTSDTDDDEWVIEFTPPAARYDPKTKHRPVYVDSETQYTYLDYRVKIFDKAGNPVPRYFKGPDGKQECSDLGGFWGPGHVWLEINRDGYIGPDNRWVPNNFIGPDGMFYSAQDGTITDNSGRLLKIGVDGYIDKDSKWAWYSKTKNLLGSHSGPFLSKNTALKEHGKGVTAKHTKPSTVKKQNPKETLNINSSKCNEKSKSPVKYSFTKGKSPVVMTAFVNFNRLKLPHTSKKEDVNANTANKYKQIMQELKLYDESFFDYNNKPFVSINRASNTPKNRHK